MELLRDAIEFLVHLDKHVTGIVGDYGGWAYAILFLIVFCETGLVVTPFLPGDSLLFAAGAVAGAGAMNVGALLVLLIAAAIIGDSVNYWAGDKIGTRYFTEEARVLKTEYLRRTEEFFERYGGKTIVIARFVPIVRTYAPFMAGVGSMSYGRFLAYNVAGGVTWVLIFVIGGYLFGTAPVVQDNFALVILAVIALSLVPVVVEVARSKRAKRRASLEA